MYDPHVHRRNPTPQAEPLPGCSRATDSDPPSQERPPAEISLLRQSIFRINLWWEAGIDRSRWSSETRSSATAREDLEHFFVASPREPNRAPPCGQKDLGKIFLFLSLFWIGLACRTCAKRPCTYICRRSQQHLRATIYPCVLVRVRTIRPPTAGGGAGRLECRRGIQRRTNQSDRQVRNSKVWYESAAVGCGFRRSRRDLAFFRVTTPAQGRTQASNASPLRSPLSSDTSLRAYEIPGCSRLLR